MKTIYYQDHLGIERALGNIPAPLTRAWPVYGDAPDQPMILRKAWEAIANRFDEDHPALAVIGVANQGAIGMCNCSAVAKGNEFTRWQQGFEHVELSAGDLYHRICGGSDNGSTLEDGMAESARGIASTRSCPYGQWQSEAPGAAEDRPSYAVTERFLCPTFDHCFSAVAEGFALVTGIVWCRNYTPDSELWLPIGKGEVGGHAIFGFKPEARTRFGRVSFGIRHLQSWGDGYGKNGQFIIGESAYGEAIGGWWAIRQAISNNTGLPPLVEG